MRTFEYFVLKGSVSFQSNLRKLEEELNSLGAQGWEVVSQTGDPGKSVYLVLKREI